MVKVYEPSAACRTLLVKGPRCVKHHGYVTSSHGPTLTPVTGQVITAVSVYGSNDFMGRGGGVGSV